MVRRRTSEFQQCSQQLEPPAAILQIILGSVRAQRHFGRSTKRRVPHFSTPVSVFQKFRLSATVFPQCKMHSLALSRLGTKSQMSASLIGRLGSNTFRLSTTTVSMSLTGSRFSSESAPRPFHHGIRGRGGTIFWSALPLDERQVQADMRTHLIHRPARDIIPPLGGARVSSYRM